VVCNSMCGQLRQSGVVEKAGCKMEFLLRQRLGVLSIVGGTAKLCARPNDLDWSSTSRGQVRVARYVRHVDLSRDGRKAVSGADATLLPNVVALADSLVPFRQPCATPLILGSLLERFHTTLGEPGATLSAWSTRVPDSSGTFSSPHVRTRQCSHLFMAWNLKRGAPMPRLKGFFDPQHYARSRLTMLISLCGGSSQHAKRPDAQATLLSVVSSPLPDLHRRSCSMAYR
jgi:hypothetical protein